MKSSPLRSLLLWVLLVLATGAALLHEAQALSAEEAEALAKKLREACLKESSVPEDEVKLINENALFSKAQKSPASHNLQCYILCYYKKIGLIDKNGKQNPVVIMEYISHVIKDDAKALSAVSGCGKVKGADDCELAYNFEKCIFEQL